MTNYSQTTFYIGITGNLQKEFVNKKNKFVAGFTKRYNIEFILIKQFLFTKILYIYKC